jgi:hypothetical protein
MDTCEFEFTRTHKLKLSGHKSIVVEGRQLSSPKPGFPFMKSLSTALSVFHIRVKNTWL